MQGSRFKKYVAKVYMVKKGLSTMTVPLMLLAAMKLEGSDFSGYVGRL